MGVPSHYRRSRGLHVLRLDLDERNFYVVFGMPVGVFSEDNSGLVVGKTNRLYDGFFGGGFVFGGHFGGIS